MFVVGMASGQWVKWSTHVSRYEYPLGGGSGPMISMWMVLNRASGELKVDNGVTVCRCTLHFWQCMHVLFHLWTSMFIPGQTYCAVINHCVTWIPGWDSEWSELKTAQRNFDGTKGCGAPVEVSHTIMEPDSDSGICLWRPGKRKIIVGYLALHLPSGLLLSPWDLKWLLCHSMNSHQS